MVEEKMNPKIGSCNQYLIKKKRFCTVNISSGSKFCKSHDLSITCIKCPYADQ